MTVKPVKFISDVLTKREIIKTDISGNVLFEVSGALPDGHVSSSLPLTASAIYASVISLSGSALGALSSSGPVHNIYDVLSNINAFVYGHEVVAGTNTQELHTGSFDAGGTKNIQLSNYAVADLSYIYANVAVRYSGTTSYKNDLMDVELSGNISANKIHVLLNAPALTSADSFRLVVNRQSGSVII